MKIKFNKIIGIFILAFIVGTFSACNKDENKENKKIQVSNEKLLNFFKEKIPDGEILLAKEENLNDDSLKDVVIIYTHDNNNEMVVVINDTNEDFKLSNSHKAPIENQGIQFKNVDEKGSLEFIISGSKNGAVGYGIYRLEDNNVIDLFGEDMDDCC